MGIQSTVNISRDAAIERIRQVYKCINECDYKELERISFETMDIRISLQEFIESENHESIKYIDNWTNAMLAKKMDFPFFRQSMFDNYIVFD